MADKETSIIFRIDNDLKAEFEEIARRSERTVSQYLRLFIKAEVQRHRQAYTIAPESIKSEKPAPHPQPIKTNPPAPQKTAIVKVNNQRKRKK